MKRCILTILIVTISISFVSDNWKEVNSEDGIKVYNRKVDGFSIPESKVVSTKEGVTLAEVKTMFLDFNTYHEWIPSCSSSKLIEKKGNVFIYYATYDAPWPVSDRDIYLEVQFSETPSWVKLEIKGLPEYRQKEEGYVRIPFNQGVWLFELQKGGSILLTNSSLSDPGGNIPDWLSSMAAEDIPLEVMQNVLERL